MTWLRALLLVSICGVLPTPARADAAPPPSAPQPIMVDPIAFRCLLVNLDRVPREPLGVFVDIRDCLRNGVKVVRHLYAPTPKRDPSGNESILFLKPEHLACMKRHRGRAERLLQAMPGNRHQLRLDPCAR